MLLLAPAASADPAQAPAPPTVTTPRDDGGSYAAAGVAFGLAAVGAGVGAVAGGLSLSDARSIESGCLAGVCPASMRSEASTARVLGNLSTASLIAGGAAALTGIVFLIVLPGPRAKAAPKAAAIAEQGAAWSAGLGLGRITIEARF